MKEFAEARNVMKRGWHNEPQEEGVSDETKTEKTWGMLVLVGLLLLP